MNKRIKNAEGLTFGLLTVLHKVEPYINPNTGVKRSKYKCKCKCGKFTEVKIDALTSGNTKSCGCLLVTANQKYTKNEVESPEYTSWRGMKERCTNINNVRYARYGGRGIKVCDEWKNDFKKFLKDMGKKPGPDYSIERIDNNKNYEPNNCKWANHEEQGRNRKKGITGELYIYINKKNNKFIVKTPKKQIGTFNTLEEAILIRDNFLNK